MHSSKSSARNWEPIVTNVLSSLLVAGELERAELLERLLERVHLPPPDANHLDGGVVEVGRRRADALLDHDRLEISEESVLACRSDALVREHSGKDHRVSVDLPQDLFQVGLEKRRETGLRHHPVLRADVELVEDVVAPRARAEAALAQEHPFRHERAAVADTARAVTGPDDWDPTAAALLVERFRRFDHAPHVLDVDVVRGVPPVRVQEVVLVIDDDVHSPPTREAPPPGAG